MFLKLKEFLNRVGLSSWSEFIGAICLESSKPLDNSHFGTSNKPNMLKGILFFLTNSRFRRNVTNNMQVALAYRNSTKFEEFKHVGGNYTTDIVARLISKNKVLNRELKILDVGCHYGYIVDDLKKQQDLKIQRYIGIDFSQDAIEKVKIRAKETYNKLGVNNYQFIYANALTDNTYKDLPIDNNLIICIGLSHITIDEAKFLLTKLYKVLSDSKDSRLYLNYNTFEEHKPSEKIDPAAFTSYLKKLAVAYGEDVSKFEDFAKNANQSIINQTIKKLENQSFRDYILEHSGIMSNVEYKMYRFNGYDFKFNAKDRCQFQKLIEDCGFKLEVENSYIPSIIIGTTADYLCLKKDELIM